MITATLSYNVVFQALTAALTQRQQLPQPGILVLMPRLSLLNVHLHEGSKFAIFDKLWSVGLIVQALCLPGGISRWKLYLFPLGDTDTLHFLLLAYLSRLETSASHSYPGTHTGLKIFQTSAPVSFCVFSSEIPFNTQMPHGIYMLSSKGGADLGDIALWPS
jgi:hypothetical protein